MQFVSVLSLNNWLTFSAGSMPIFTQTSLGNLLGDLQLGFER